VTASTASFRPAPDRSWWCRQAARLSPRGFAEKADIQKAIDTIKREAARAKVEEEK
jgi:hypothetical protein